MRSKIALGIVLLLVMLPLQLTRSQEQTAPFTIGEDWTYQRACLQEDVSPPADWSWNGTILLSGPYGIHGYRADWETTRVLAFRREADGVITGSLSPNGQWSVRMIGYSACSDQACNHFDVRVREIEVYRLSEANPHQSYTLSWVYTDLHSIFYSPQITWLDNEHFVYYRDPGKITMVVDVQNGSVSEWNGEPSNIISPTYLSPDHTRDFESIYDPNTRTSSNVLIEPLSGEVIAELSETQNQVEPYPYEIEELWSPQSAYFLAISRLQEGDYEEILDQLWLYDRDGNQITHILTASPLTFGPFGRISWSPDDRKLMIDVIVWEDPRSQMVYTVLVDIVERQFTELCETGYAYVWSPDGDKILFTNNYQLVVLDIPQMAWYTISNELEYYDAFGWRDD